jgi:hypothetical protein
MAPDRMVVPAPPDGNCPDIEAVVKCSDVQRGIEPVYHSAPPRAFFFFGKAFFLRAPAGTQLLACGARQGAARAARGKRRGLWFPR